MSLVKSAQRTLQILEYFDQIRRPATIMMIAEALRYPHSSTSALLRSLVSMGYLAYDARARLYQPTERVPLLGSWVSPLCVQAGSAQQLIEALSKMTGLNAVLVASNQTHVQCIHSSRHNDNTHPAMRLGAESSIFHSPFGALFLASRKDSDIKLLVRSFNAYASPQERIIPAKLLSTLIQVRDDGYSLGHEGGLELLGKRLPPSFDTRPLAVGLIGKHHQLDRTILPSLIDREISRWIRPDKASQEAEAPEVSNQASLTPFRMMLSDAQRFA